MNYVKTIFFYIQEMAGRGLYHTDFRKGFQKRPPQAEKQEVRQRR